MAGWGSDRIGSPHPPRVAPDRISPFRPIPKRMYWLVVKYMYSLKDLVTARSTTPGAVVGTSEYTCVRPVVIWPTRAMVPTTRSGVRKGNRRVAYRSATLTSTPPDGEWRHEGTFERVE